MKIPNKREHYQIAYNHLSKIDFKDFMNIYKKYCKNTAKQKKSFQKKSFRKNIKTNYDN